MELKPIPDPDVTVLQNWWDAYPSVKSTPLEITTDEVAGLIKESLAASHPSGSYYCYAVIDVRRNDHAGGHVRGSQQWPAQSFYDELPRFFEQFRDTEKVIFYCGSSRGRGPRCAGWYQDYLDSVVGEEHKSKAYVMQGGIKEWLSKFQGHDDDLVDYDDA